MKSGDLVSCTPSEENVNPICKLNMSKISRNSNMYSSLPSHYEFRKDRESEIVPGSTANNLVSESTNTIGRKRKVSKNQQIKNVMPKLTNIEKRSMHPLYDNLNESNSEHSFGISNNLSTESIINACGFYDDDLSSDDDLIEVQSTPGCFQKQPSSSRKSVKMNCFYNESRKKCKSSEENPLCELSRKSEDELSETYEMATPVISDTIDCKQDDAIGVLQELDAILDDHDTSQLNSSLGSEMETKVEDCLLDLDNYLEEMDDCSETNYDNDEKYFKDCLARKHSSLQCQSRTLPKNKKSYPATDIVEVSSKEFQRGHGLRKTISCALERQYKDLTPEYETPRSRNSVRKTDLVMFSDVPYQENSEVENLSTVDNTNVESGNVECGNVDNSNSGSSSIIDLNRRSHTNLSGELRRCFSQSDCTTRIASTTSNETLTQDNIFNNLLVQSGSNNRSEDRPRQFGRRAEGYPRICSITNNSCTIVNHEQRPMSAPVTATHAALYMGSEASSVRSSRNASPVSIVSSSDYSSMAASTNGNIDSNLVVTDNLQPQNTPHDVENSESSPLPGMNSAWPHKFSRTFALTSCTLGLFNVCRFSVLTIQYGSNFLLQFLLLSFLFGIPLFWLQMCLGAKIKSGPVSMWRISPICKGIGIALITVQCLIAIYSTVTISWLLVYLRDSFLSKTQMNYRWQEAIYSYRNASNTTNNLTESVADYFNIVVLQRLQYVSKAEGNTIKFRVSDRLAFNLALLWAAVFLILCKGLKSFGKSVFVISTLPLIALAIVTCRLLYVVDFSQLMNVFNAADFDDFLINSKTWTAAAQEAFLTWGLLGSSVVSISSRCHIKDSSKTTLRRDAIVVVLVTLLGLSIAALLGLSCMQILHQHSYVYVPGSFEKPEGYTAVYSLKASISTTIVSFPPKWVPHYSSFIGETYRRPATLANHDSGYQALRFISELFPAVIVLSRDSISWIWTVMAFSTFIMLGLAQLCAMWKPISSALGNSTSSVLLSCVTGLLLSIPFATEVGISILHYMDLLLGGSWFIPILWAAQIFGVFLIRGRPYNGDDLVNDLNMSGSMSAFLALSWNVLLPIGLITLAVIDYKTSLTNQFYYWRVKSYFSYWARKVAGLSQIGFLLLVPVTAIVQIYRYLTTGPADILERIQLLYRPSDNSGNRRGGAIGGNIENIGGILQSTHITNNRNLDRTQEDAPPKYTPPPSYTTATGARLAKLLRQSIRRSVRRIMGEPGRSRPILPIDTELNQQSLPPDYSTVLTNPSGNTDSGNQASIETVEIGQQSSSRQNTQRSFSLGRKILQKQRWESSSQRPSSASRVLETHLTRPYTAEDVVTILRSSTRVRQQRSSSLSRELNIIHPQSGNSFRSIENLILNAEPLDQSSAIVSSSSNAAETSNDQNN